MLRAQEVQVRFGGLMAVDEATIEVRDGLVTALIGPNGAGKTTLYNALMGVVPLEHGRIELAGEDITHQPAHQRARRGLVRTFQTLQLVDDSSVLENLLVGAGPLLRAGPFGSLARLPRARGQDSTAEALARRAAAVAGVPSVDVLAGELPAGLRRRLEVARTLMSGPRVVLLDEPAAGLDAGETHDLGALISRIRDELRAAVLVVEHDMSLVRGFADYVYVLNFGRMIAQGSPDDVLRDPEVVAAYLG